MIYKTVTDELSTNKIITNDFMLETIYKDIHQNQGTVEDIAVDLISLYTKLKGITTEKINQALTTGFYYLFSQGLTWEKIQEL